MKIYKFPDDKDFLKYTSIPLTKKPKEYPEYHQIKQFLEDKHNRAAGLAAVQIGSHIRLFGVKVEEMPGFRPKVIMFANPQIIYQSDKTKLVKESCLSEPGISRIIQRSVYINITYLNGENISRSLHLYEFNARVFQHEMDHLNGILLSDIKEK